MMILAIETSGAVGSVAVSDDRAILASHTFGQGARHARNVMPAIDEVIRRAGLTKEQIEAVAVSAGPGSFTGLRVGITCAMTLAWALGGRAAAVPSLAVMAQNVDPSAHGGCRHTCPIVDARRDKVYGTVFEWTGAEWADTTDVLLDGPRRLADMLPPGTLIFGSGVRAYPQVFVDPQGSEDGRFPVGQVELEAARAEAVAELGLRLIRAGQDVDPMKLAPRYYRLTEPEEKLAFAPGPTQEEA